MEKKNLSVIVYGAGAVGSTIGGWLSQHYPNVSLLARGKNAEVMKTKGLTLYKPKKKIKLEIIPVRVIEDLAEQPSAEVIIIAVKNYNLEEVAKDIKEKMKEEPIIVALQNGVENQKVLSKYFSKVIYGVVCYNAWRDGPGIFGYHRQGPVILGTIDNKYRSELEEISQIFNLGCKTEITEKLQDTTRSKMIINLMNSLMTLVGHGSQEFTLNKKLLRVAGNLIREGIDILQAAGYHEYRIKTAPAWRSYTLLLKLPAFITLFIFRRKVKKMVINSMAQDILNKEKKQTELDTLNGAFLELADSVNHPAPYNRTIYEICKQRFNQPEFQPLSVNKLWEKIEEATA